MTINNADEARAALEKLRGSMGKMPSLVKMVDELTAKRVTGTAGAGMVEVVVNGVKECQSIKIDPTVCAKLATDPEFLEDLLVAAFNDAGKKVEASIPAIMPRPQPEGLPSGLQDAIKKLIS